MVPRALAFIAFAAAAALGLAAGAESQRETFLHADGWQDVGLQDAAGNLVTLLAILPALAISIAAVLISRRPWQRCLAPGAGVLVTSYFLIWLIQSAWPNYDALQELRSARFSITPLITNGAAVGSVYVGPMALLLAFGMAFWASLRSLVPTENAPPTPEALVRRFVGAYLLAAPFLLVLAAGNLQLAVALPDGQQELSPYLFVFPVGALAALGLLLVGALQGWHLGAFARNGRMADAARDAWGWLRTTQWILAGVLGGLALLATLLQAIDHDLLQAGRTFGLTTRGHVQAQILLAFPLLPLLVLDGPVQRMLDQGDGHAATLDVGTHPLVLGSWIAMAAGALGVVAAALFLDGALWAWAFALAPAVIFGWLRLPARLSLWPALLLAVVLWGMGNHIEGNFLLDENSALSFTTPPGLLALSRLLAVVVIAVAVARSARAEAELPRGLRVVVSGGLGAAVALVVFLELPFTAWIATGARGQYVGIGSVVASQDFAVRATFHTLATIAAGLAGLAIARIHRPDWFGPRAEPVSAPELHAAT